MLDKDKTFCDSRRIHGVCFECERHIRHESNQQFKVEQLYVKSYKAVRTKTHGVHCDHFVKGLK